jgi:glycine cleavage system H protein
MSQETLRLTIDKFTFLVPTGVVYSDAGVWVKLEAARARLGVSDFVQQSNGDVTFANVKPVGTHLQSGDEFAEIETVKVNVSIPSPVRGTIVEINSSLEQAPEGVNQDPYGKGWMAVVEPSDWESDRVHLLEPSAYLMLVKEQAEAEMKK